MDNKNEQIQNTVNMMAECLRDNANAHLLAVRVGDGATFTITRNEKLDNLASWFKDNSTTIEFADKKAKEWQKEKKRLTNLNNRIMRYMTETIDEAGVKQIKTENHILKPRSFRESTIIDDTELIPKTYIKTEVVNKLDKKAIYQALRDGEEVEGAHLEPNRKTRIL